MNRHQRWRNRLLSRAVRAVPFFLLERLEDRTLMSGLTYDLRFAPGQLGVGADEHSVDLSQPHSNTYTLQVWSQISGDTDFTNDAWCQGMVSLASAQFGGGAITSGGIASAIMNRALFSIGHDGTPGDFSHDGIGDWGNPITRSTIPWMFFSSLQKVMGGQYIPGLSQPSKQDPLHSWEVLVGTFFVNIDAIASPDAQDRTTTFNVIPAPKMIALPLIYVQDGVIQGSSLSPDQIDPGITFRLPATTSQNEVGFTKALSRNTPVNFIPAYFTDAFRTVISEGALQSIQITALPGHGTLKLNAQTVRLNQTIDADQLAGLSYVPDPGFCGSDAVGWMGSNGSAFAGGAIDLSVVNIPPLPPISIDLTGRQNSPLDITFAFSDQDPGDALQFIRIDKLPSGGILTVSDLPVTAGQPIPFSSASSLIYTPNPGFAGTDSFVWNVSDGVDFASIPANTMIQVLPVPTASPPAPVPAPPAPPPELPAPAPVTTDPPPPPAGSAPPNTTPVANPAPPAPPPELPGPTPVTTDVPEPPVIAQPPASSAPPDTTPVSNPAPPVAPPPAATPTAPPDATAPSDNPVPPSEVTLPPADTTIPPTEPVVPPPVEIAPIEPAPVEPAPPAETAPLQPVGPGESTPILPILNPPGVVILPPMPIGVITILGPIDGVLWFDQGMVCHPICVVWDSGTLDLALTLTNSAGTGRAVVGGDALSAPLLPSPVAPLPATDPVLPAPALSAPVGRDILAPTPAAQRPTPLLHDALAPLRLHTAPRDDVPVKEAPFTPGTPSSLPAAPATAAVGLDHSPLSDNWQSLLQSDF